MAQSVSVVCPSCGAVLKVTKPSLIGKRVACPSCKKPVLIQAPTEGSAPPKTPKDKAALQSAPLPRADRSELETVLLADDDPPGRPAKSPLEQSPAAGSSQAKSAGAPVAKARRSAVWKQMGQTETAEFEAMLSDSDEPDDPTVELAFAEGGRSSTTIPTRPNADGEANGDDGRLLDTDAEQNEVTAEMSEVGPSKKKKLSKAKRAAKPPSDEFDVLSDDAEPAATVLRRGTARPATQPPATAPRGQKSTPAPKLPLIIGALAGSALLIGLLFYSISGAHTPPPLTESPAVNVGAVAEGNDDSATTSSVQKETSGSAAAKAKSNDGKGRTNAVAAADRSGGDGKDRAAESSGEASEGAGPTQPGPKAVAATIGASGTIATKDAETPTGKGPVRSRKVPAFSAAAIDNTTFQSADSKQKVLVVAFLGVECPLANLYYPRLVALAQKYKGKSVGFLAVNSNAQDTLEAVQKQARSNAASFPVLKDAGNAVAGLFGAERTPEVFVLDAERSVRYHGMLDDQYGYGYRRAQPTQNYVVDAVDALLSSGTVSVTETPVQGCHIGRVTKPSETAHTSFYRDVLPVLQNRCQQCHRKGEIGPFALKDYAEVRDWGPTIREAVAERRMPPWPADPHFGKFSNDISLSSAETATITKWVDEGCPEGNPAEKPPEKKFVDGWNIGKPDRIYTMERSFHVPASGVIQYQNIYASPAFAQDTWVQAVECRFGNRSVVHHMLVLLDFPNDRSRSQDGLVKGFFAAGVPGCTSFVFPKGYAKRIPKGARLRFQMHYTPNGTPADDQSRLGIVLAKGREREVQTYALGKVDINIPAGNADHMETATQTLNGDIILSTLMPHLHLRGKSFTFTVVWPSGKKETLLSVPRWDFNWQPQYQLAKPIALPKDSKIIVEAHWDNSANNPNNILPPVDVQFGEQTFDEMFIGYVNYVPKSLADATRPRGRKRGG